MGLDANKGDCWAAQWSRRRARDGAAACSSGRMERELWQELEKEAVPFSCTVNVYRRLRGGSYRAWGMSDA